MSMRTIPQRGLANSVAPALAGIIISAVSILFGVIFWLAVIASSTSNGLGFSRVF